VLRASALGALLGLVTAIALGSLPSVLAHDFYEYTDALMVFSVVLVPLGAGVGGFIAGIRGQAGRPGLRARKAAIVAAFVLLVVVLWQLFARLTGVPGLI
jgi:hypothetical protein